MGIQHRPEPLVAHRVPDRNGLQLATPVLGRVHGDHPDEQIAAEEGAT
ncbi:hypothetical protein ACSHWO_37560 (plasmid) [Streptomyces sp. HUAS TT3]